VEAAAAATVPVRLQEMWRQADGLHKPFGLVFASAHVLGTACALTGALATPAPPRRSSRHTVSCVKSMMRIHCLLGSTGSRVASARIQAGKLAAG